MTISDMTDIPASIRTRIAATFATRRRRRAAPPGGTINAQPLRDIGLTPFGVPEAPLAERNEARR